MAHSSPFGLSGTPVRVRVLHARQACCSRIGFLLSHNRDYHLTEGYLHTIKLATFDFPAIRFDSTCALVWLDRLEQS